jgi:hypothetical protein
MKYLLLLWNHRTAISGGIQTTAGMLAAAGYLSAAVTAGIVTGVGVLQVWIGIGNTIAAGKADQ